MFLWGSVRYLHLRLKDMKEGSSPRHIIHEGCCVTSLKDQVTNLFSFLVEAGHRSDWRSDSIHLEASRNPFGCGRDTKDLLPRGKQKGSKHVNSSWMKNDSLK